MLSAEALQCSERGGVRERGRGRVTGTSSLHIRLEPEQTATLSVCVLGLRMCDATGANVGDMNGS